MNHRFARLTHALLPAADAFAAQLADSTTFTHFRHTSPAAMLGENWRVWLLLNDAGECVAWAQAQVFAAPKEHVARLGLAVAPAYQGAGLGGQVIDHLIRECEDKAKLTASVFEDNARSLALFEHRGFLREGRFVDEERWASDGTTVSRNVVSLARFT